jgi:phage RecT family recombinase
MSEENKEVKQNSQEQNGAPAGAVVNWKSQSIAGMLSRDGSPWKRELAKVLPNETEVARFMAVALLQLSDPKVGGKLARCTKESFYNSIMSSARSGILPDGTNGYLIPYGTTCTLQFSYRGLCDVAIRNGIATHFASDIVRRNDVFVWRNGCLVEHTVDGWDDEERGEVVGGWCRAFLPDGQTQDMRMSKKEIEKVRSKAQSDNVWSEWWEEMAKKACLKRLFKTMRNTPQLAEAIKADNELYDLSKSSSLKKRVVSNRVFEEGEDDAVEAEVVGEEAD